jgi:hypothetical protein
MSEQQQTSIEAYEKVKPKLNRLEQLVLDVIQSYGERGCTSDEVRNHLTGLSYSSVTARYSSLERKGLIIRDGRTRAGNRGSSQMIMWDTECYMVQDVVA